MRTTPLNTFRADAAGGAGRAPRRTARRSMLEACLGLNLDARIPALPDGPLSRRSAGFIHLGWQILPYPPHRDADGYQTTPPHLFLWSAPSPPHPRRHPTSHGMAVPLGMGSGARLPILHCHTSPHACLPSTTTTFLYPSTVSCPFLTFSTRVGFCHGTHCSTLHLHAYPRAHYTTAACVGSPTLHRTASPHHTCCLGSPPNLFAGGQTACPKGLLTGSAAGGRLPAETATSCLRELRTAHCGWLRPTSRHMAAPRCVGAVPLSTPRRPSLLLMRCWLRRKNAALRIAGRHSLRQGEAACCQTFSPSTSC